MEAVRGRITARRVMGKLAFVGLSDETGSIQVSMHVPTEAPRKGVEHAQQSIMAVCNPGRFKNEQTSRVVACEVQNQPKNDVVASGGRGTLLKKGSWRTIFRSCPQFSADSRLVLL